MPIQDKPENRTGKFPRRIAASMHGHMNGGHISCRCLFMHVIYIMIALGTHPSQCSHLQSFLKESFQLGQLFLQFFLQYRWILFEWQCPSNLLTTGLVIRRQSSGGTWYDCMHGWLESIFLAAWRRAPCGGGVRTLWPITPQWSKQGLEPAPWHVACEYLDAPMQDHAHMNACPCAWQAWRRSRADILLFMFHFSLHAWILLDLIQLRPFILPVLSGILTTFRFRVLGFSICARQTRLKLKHACMPLRAQHWTKNLLMTPMNCHCPAYPGLLHAWKVRTLDSLDLENKTYMDHHGPA